MLASFVTCFCAFAAASSLLVAPLGAFAKEQTDLYLKDGDRVVFYGDSITQQRMYSLYVEEYVHTRFPQHQIEFIHSGVGGDRVTGGGAGSIDERLSRDVIAHRPTVVTIMLGMNDARYRAFDEAILAEYIKGYEYIVKTLKAKLPGVRLTLIQPSPYDDVTCDEGFAGGYNRVLQRYGAFVKELAAREKCQTVDFNAPVVAALARAKARDASLATMLIPDRVHPAEAAHWLMAMELLKAWGAQALVSAVEIDAARSTIVRSDHTTISEWNAQPDEWRWQQQDRALPLPIFANNPATALMLQTSLLTETLNQQMLRVTGLRTGKYQLLIDGVMMGTYAHEALTAGINLALLRTPMMQQAYTVHWETEARQNACETRAHLLRQSGLSNEDETRQTLAALDAMLARAASRIRAKAQPQKHTFQLKRL